MIDDGHKNKETEKKAHLNNKNSENIKPNDLDKYCLFFYEDEEKNKKFYSFHSDHENKYELRCKDRNCSGTAQYDVESGEINITKKYVLLLILMNIII